MRRSLRIRVHDLKRILLLVPLVPIFLCSGCDAPDSEGGRTIPLAVYADDRGSLQLRADRADVDSMLIRDVPRDVAFVGGSEITGFETGLEQESSSVDDEIGAGESMVVRGTAELPGGGRLTRTSEAIRYDAFPNLVFLQTSYVNAGSDTIVIDSVYAQQHRLRSPIGPSDERPPFWSFQASSYSNRPDWIIPLQEGYRRYNYQGMNATDYGGGVPVVDLWTPTGGVAVGHVSTEPRLVSLPVETTGPQQVDVRIVDAARRTLAPGDTIPGIPTFTLVHDGDYFSALTTYAAVMERLGLEMPQFPETAYEPIWCAWGYGRRFSTDVVLATIPKVKALGLDWVVLDDGWQTAEGDWFLHPERFPDGDEDMRAFVDTVHANDLKAKIWWVPFAADPGTQLEEQHPDWFLMDENGERRRISWWDAYYLCPAVPAVREHTEQLIGRFIEDWGFDGLKIDGQNLNAVPPCYNPAHNHADPEESVRAVPAYFQAIYERAISAKPYAVVELCPCGDAASLYNMPHNNQPVASDPTSSWQIRTKGKTFKALMGPSVPYYGDHVELSDGGSDFASTVGIGGVVGTKFTWAPQENRATAGWLREEGPSRNLLTDEREEMWKKWIGLYKDLDLGRGTYRGELYDVGYDRPEAHAIEKDGAMYFAFYAPSWNGVLQLRGLGNGSFAVRDYVSDEVLGTVTGPTAELDVSFEHALLLETSPE